MLSEASFIVKGVASVKFEYSQECFLGYFNGADLFHALLAFFLFFEEFALSRYIAAVALGCHVFADCFYGFARYNFGADCGLDGYLELLARDEFL